MKNLFAYIWILLFIMSCSMPTGEIVGDGPIKIGISAPLTGEAVSYGQGMMTGVKLAIADINARGGINGREVIAVFEDDKCGSEAVKTMTRLVNIEKVDAIFGPVCSAAAGPSLPVVQESRTPIVIGASAPYLTTLGDYIFRTYPNDAFAGSFIAEHLYDQGVRRTAAIYTKNDWGQGFRDSFVDRFVELGGEIVLDESVESEDEDLRTVVLKLKESDAEVLMTSTYPTNCIALLRQMQEQGINIPVWGGDSFETAEIKDSGVAEGAYYVLANIGYPEEFRERILAIGGFDHTLSPWSYDAIMVIAEAIEKAGTDKEALRDALAQTNYEGIGVKRISFDENGDLETVDYDIKTIKDGKPVIIG